MVRVAAALTEVCTLWEVWCYLVSVTEFLSVAVWLWLIPWGHVPCLSASEVMIHEEALFYQDCVSTFRVIIFN